MESTPFFRGIAALLIAVLALLLSFAAWAQGATGAAAVFEGRPAMAGAQGGVGAQAGPPQGGLGVQGTQGSQLRLARPGIVETPREAVPGLAGTPPTGVAMDRPEGLGMQPPRDPGVIRDPQNVTR